MGELREFRKKDDPHIAGEAVCPCGHKWVAVAPVGTVFLECPACHSERGLYKFHCVPEGKFIWECVCGCSVFIITTEHAYCISCGYAKPLIELEESQ